MGCKSTAPPAAVDTGAGGDRQLCQDACDGVAGLNCPDQSADCVPACESRLALGICTAENRAALACGIAATMAAFICNDQGRTVLKPGYCLDEQAALVTCVRQPPDGG